MSGTVAAPARVEAAPVGLARGRVVDLDRVASLACLLLLGLREDLRGGVTTGAVAILATAPVWWSAARHYRKARAFLVFGFLTIGWGLALTLLLTPVRANRLLTVSTTVTLLSVVGGVGVILWARQHASTRAIGVAYGAGLLLSCALGLGGDHLANPWKFVWGLPVAVVVLSLTAGRGRLVDVGALMALAVTSAAFDSRSYTAAFALAGLLVFWPLRPTRQYRLAWVATSGLLLAIAFAAYRLATALLVEGYLGQAAQIRTIRQLDTAGSVILGGRPELGATLALMRAHPGGFGVGYAPTPDVVATAKTGMASLNYDPDNGYVERFMFGGHIELHSLLGDLWAHWGIPGLAFAALLAVVTVRTLANALLYRKATGLQLFLAYFSLWSLLFAPLLTSVPIITLWLGAVFVQRAPDISADSVPASSRAGGPEPAAAMS